jgi:quaternary ammonium compound-resistance protein SugE
MPGWLAWSYLVVAGVLEIVWAIGLKYAAGFSRLVPSVVTIAAMLASVWFLALALRTIPVGTGYAVWTGIGSIGTAILGMILFAEPATAARLACIGLIVAGIAGLKLVS